VAYSIRPQPEVEMRGLTPCLAAICLAAGVAQAAPAARSEAADRAAVERLHAQDVAATLSDDAEQLKALWDADAVRLQQGIPAEVGRAKIFADDSSNLAKNHGHILSYAAHVQDLQISGDRAIEWGVFEASARTSADAPVQTVSGKQLRALKRQPDGSWKFTHVMVVLDQVK
jgi:ketosteroid isomerase-like protein